MKTPAIDMIRTVFNSGIYPELERIAGENRDECSAELAPLDKLLDSLPLDKKAKAEVLDMGAALFLGDEEFSFRRGFRVGAQLMRECFGDPEPMKSGI